MIDTPYIALLNVFKRMRNLNGREKFSLFEEYKEWIIDDYSPDSIFFIREDPII